MTKDPNAAARPGADQEEDSNSGKSGHEPGKGSRANQARQTDETAVRQPNPHERTGAD